MLATESYVRLLDKRTPIHCDQDYLNYLVVNHATVPDRTTWILIIVNQILMRP